MAKVLELINGVPRMRIEAAGGALPTIYKEELLVVASSPGAGEIIPVTTGDPVTLPNAETYDSAELEVRLNGKPAIVTEDFNFVSSPPRTQVSFTFDLLEDDRIEFEKLRDV